MGNSEMFCRILGSTGEKVSIVGLGGAHIGWQETENDSIRIVRTAIDNGVNFMDNCWDYNNGQSEIRMGKALRDGYRSKVFLMTKVDGRDKRTASQQLDESLRRLQTDHIDLLQFHEIIRMSDPVRIFGPGGALEGVLEARKAGKVRYIGFTGHKSPRVHLKMLQTASDNGFTFDAVQMPLNVMDAHYDSFEKKVLPVLSGNRIGVLGMKPLGGGELLRSDTVTAIECLHYAMSLPISVVITGCDSLAVLQQALEAVGSFSPMSEEQRSALLARTAKAAHDGKYELYKTGTIFDATSQNPDWLG
jgi:aryl-alcohol dehydrogenase-like predicted oxidoreductase